MWHQPAVPRSTVARLGGSCDSVPLTPMQNVGSPIRHTKQEKVCKHQNHRLQGLRAQLAISTQCNYHWKHHLAKDSHQVKESPLTSRLSPIDQKDRADMPLACLTHMVGMHRMTTAVWPKSCNYDALSIKVDLSESDIN